MTTLGFASFQNLVAKLSKELLFDAVKPQLKLYAEHKFPGMKKGEAYEVIFDHVFQACGASSASAGNDIENNIVGRMGNGSGGKSGNYKSDKIHGVRLYYFFLYSEHCDDPIYGDRISDRLYKKKFFEAHEGDLRRLGMSRPPNIAPAKIIRLGPLTISLGYDGGLNEFSIPEQYTKADLIDDQGLLDVYAALHWRSRLSGLYGREEPYNRLIDWALDDRKQAKIMLVSGPGGVGKTRLVADVLEKLVFEKGWRGGFLPARFEDNQDALDGSGNGVLAIIDYPEEKTAEVARILKAAVNPVEYDKPVRIILVSRENKERWSNILNEPRLERFEEISLELQCHLSREDALAIINDVAEGYPPLVGRQHTALAGAEEWLDSDPTNHLPLYALSATIHAVLSPDSAFGLSGKDVLFALADMELKRVQSYSERNLQNPNALKKLLALSLLTDIGMTKETIHALGDMGICAGKTGDSLLECVEATPFWRKKTEGKPSYLVRIEPDLPAAALMMKALRLDDHAPGLANWLAPIALQTGAEFGDILGRVAVDLALFDSAASLEIGNIAVSMLDKNPKLVKLLEKLAYRKPHPYSVGLSIAICKNLLLDVKLDEDRLWLLNSYSNMLSSIGNSEEALLVNGIALSILANENPECTDLNGICSFLYNGRGSIFSALNNAEDSLRCYRRALEFSLSGERSYVKDFFQSLTNQISVLTKLGRSDEAQNQIEMGFQLWNAIASAGDDPEKHWLARLLTAKADLLSSVGSNSEALICVEKAEEIWKKIVELDSDDDQLNLATTLISKGIILKALGLLEVSRGILAQQAIPIYRALVYPLLDAVQPALANALSNYAGVLAELGQHQEALDASSEALTIRRHLASGRPDSFNSELSLSLGNQAGILHLSGRTAEALPFAREAVELQRNFARDDGAISLINRVDSLINIDVILSEMGEDEESIAVSGDISSAYRSLYIHDKRAFGEKFAKSLRDQAAKLLAIHKFDDAQAVIDELQELLRCWGDISPDASGPDFSELSYGLATMLLQLDRSAEALLAINNSLMPNNLLYEKNKDIAGRLNTKASILCNLSMYDEALEIVDDAISIYQSLLEINPEEYYDNLQMSIYNKGIILFHLNRNSDAINVFDGMVEICRSLSHLLPDLFGPRLANELHNKATALGEDGQHKLALDVHIESISALKKYFLECPEKHSYVMGVCLCAYADSCERLNVPVDEGILGPIVGKIETRGHNHRI